jgi:hypothetical protein
VARRARKFKLFGKCERYAQLIDLSMGEELLTKIDNEGSAGPRLGYLTCSGAASPALQQGHALEFSGEDCIHDTELSGSGCDVERLTQSVACNTLARKQLCHRDH